MNYAGFLNNTLIFEFRQSCQYVKFDVNLSTWLFKQTKKIQSTNVDKKCIYFHLDTHSNKRSAEYILLI